MTEESNSQAGRTPTEKPVRRTKFSLVRVLVTALICFMILYVFLLPAIFDARSPQPGRVSCLANLKGLGSCLALYAYDYNDVYPPQNDGAMQSSMPLVLSIPALRIFFGVPGPR
jgi:hypothetical protein